MKNKKSIQNLLLIAFALFFAACFVIIVVADAVITGSQKEYSQNEEDTALTEIQFSSAGVLADSPAVTINGSVATVTEPGAYFITGYCENGGIVFDIPETAEADNSSETKCEITLSELSLASAKGSPFIIVSGDDFSINLEGDNQLYDSDNYDSGMEMAAGLYSKKGIEIAGNGTLKVVGNTHHGISVRGSLKISSGNIEAYAPDNAIDAKREVTILGGNIKLTAGGDGINVKNNDDLSEGSINIYNGKVNIKTQDDGLSAADTIRIEGGTVNVDAGKRLYRAGKEAKIADNCFFAKRLED